VSGGHSQLVLFRDHFDYTLLGRTRDDAIGEAFDKVAKILGLPYPGGPSIAKAATEGDASTYQFPKAHLDTPYDFSFSGLKTAVLRLAQKEIGEDFTFPSYMLPERLSVAQKHNIAASFQRVAIETVIDKTVAAYKEYAPTSVVIAGGVAANSELRRQLNERLAACPTPSGSSPTLHVTDMKLCTDNGAMIAALGCYKAMLAQQPVDPYEIQIAPNLKM
jgi:N6-L-threonylcarbamoyladenine synthase